MALLTAYGLIFVAELPDKTAATVVLLASRQRPLPVLLGSWCAFLVQNLIAVGLGTLLSRLPPQTVYWVSAAVFAAFGLWLLLRREAGQLKEPPAPTHKAFAGAFALVFAAEIGDATQLGTAALVARIGHRWSVFAGSTLALWSVAALGVTLGNKLGARLPRALLRRVAGVAFLAFALVSVLLAERVP